MNLVQGKLLDDSAARAALSRLPQTVMETLSGAPLDCARVIRACDALSGSLSEREHLPLLTALGFDEDAARETLREVKALLSAESLRARLTAELGADFGQPRRVHPIDRGAPVIEREVPLGVLMHIAAGNAQGLPALSVVEGLLTGNVNLLKLPGAGDDLSVRLLLELIRIDPLLAPYIYAFDFPSTDSEAMEAMALAADAIVVWGGDEAVRAIRRLARPDTQVIEWGHKISFAYVSGPDIGDAQFAALARHICRTEQLLCSSCQGIYVDTREPCELYGFCERFIGVLESESAKRPRKLDISAAAQLTLQLRAAELDAPYSQRRVYRGRDCSLIACGDRRLETSMLYRNCWVKALPRDSLIQTLRPNKGYLQTAGLLCADGKREELSALLAAAGVVRVTSPQNMSAAYCGMPHDGQYALRRYVKTVSLDYEDAL